MREMPVGKHIAEPPAPGHPPHERQDVRIGSIIKFGIGLGVIAVIVHLLILGFYGLLIQRSQNAQPRLTEVEQSERVQLPKDLGNITEPRLQESDVADYRVWQDKWVKKLNSYGWVDRKQGIVNIPIEQAIKILSDPARQGEFGIKSSAKK